MEQSGLSPLGREGFGELLSSMPSRIAPPSVDGAGLGVGLTGCGGISDMHLGAYRRLGLQVSALCSRDISKAERRAHEFAPEANIYASHAELLEDQGVEVVDIATHPEGRGPLISAALRAGKHVLSQKPFVLSVPDGLELVELAAGRGLTLAVNQNGRWAPHFAAIREFVRAGAIGEVEEIAASVSWDHSWTIGTAFDQTPHLVLFDFGIHWFDFVVSLLGDRSIHQVSARVEFSPGQRSPQPMLAIVEMRAPGLHVSLSFDGDEQRDPKDQTRVSGSHGVLTSAGSDLHGQGYK